MTKYKKLLERTIDACVGRSGLYLDETKRMDLGNYGVPRDLKFRHLDDGNLISQIDFFYVKTDEHNPNCYNDSNFSFDSLLYREFLDRVSEFNITNGSMLANMNCKLEWNPLNRRYQIDTEIKLGTDFDEDIIIFLDYMNNITENPDKIILDEEMQEKFRKSVRNLVRGGIDPRLMYESKEIFFKTYEISSFIMDTAYGKNYWFYQIDPEELVPARKELYDNLDTTVQNAVTRTERLNDLELLEIDYEKIRSMKDKITKEDIGKLNKGDKGGFGAFRDLIKNTEAEVDPILQLNDQSSIRDIYSKLRAKKFKEIFPFQTSLEMDIGFLNYIVSK